MAWSVGGFARRRLREGEFDNPAVALAHAGDAPVLDGLIGSEEFNDRVVASDIGLRAHGLETRDHEGVGDKLRGLHAATKNHRRSFRSLIEIVARRSRQRCNDTFSALGIFVRVVHIIEECQHSPGRIDALLATARQASCRHRQREYGNEAHAGAVPPNRGARNGAHPSDERNRWKSPLNVSNVASNSHYIAHLNTVKV